MESLDDHWLKKMDIWSTPFPIPPSSLFSPSSFYFSFAPSFHNYTLVFARFVVFLLLLAPPTLIFASSSHPVYVNIYMLVNIYSEVVLCLWGKLTIRALLRHLATHAADGSYPVHLVPEAATPRRGPPFLVSGLVSLWRGLVVKKTSPHPSGPGVHA